MDSIRIRTTPNGGDKYIKIKLTQNFKFLEVLSLKISQEDVYRDFCSDYGVIVGRVVVNNGFGVPNAKVSVFIPIDDVDKDNNIIKELYPYEKVTDKNSDGIRYNLLPKQSLDNNDCFTVVGTFPNKREFLDNEDLLTIYEKYYKFTTTTNDSGDFMIFGVPIGNHTLHVDADISDIGIISQRPYDLISQGSPLKLFDSPTKFKTNTNIDTLPQIKSFNIGVNVQPFWGDMETCEIGISRVDIDLNLTITPSAIFMGSIFGDQDKNSINKNCIPRKDMGEICSQVSNEGTIEMIRKTIDGNIENFDINGGRVIDDNGSWAYQIPMNLDYYVTDEYGDLTLSEDPNKGIPTRSSVRFRIGMDQTGNEGRLRTRAKYLIPNNPTNVDEIDYEFGEKTKDVSFRDIYWNKIYSINNYITRFDKDTLFSSRTFTGIKDVDACEGDKNPHPYNRVDTLTNPLFFVICLIIKIIGGIVWLINNVLLFILNGAISVWNAVFDSLCSVARTKFLGIRPFYWILGWTCKLHIDYIQCIHVKCPGDDGAIYAPGCRSDMEGWRALANNKLKPTYYQKDPFCHDGFMNLAGLDDCIAIQMAEILNMFRYDFYNDWINGSLYSYLLKYKKRGNKEERFCEYDCSDFGISNGSVDGNNDNQADNKCISSSIDDTGFNSGIKIGFNDGANSQNQTRTPGKIREGLIKKYNNEFYYAASTHDARLKLFATDIINLGSVFECDWQGVPKIQEYLTPTTYKLPPLNQEIDRDGKTVLTTGQCSLDGENTECNNLGGNSFGLFFDINCSGLHSNYRQILNIRHICEFGVDLDEYNGPSNQVDGIIGSKELELSDDTRVKYFRDVFYGLNKDKNSWLLNLPYNTNFNVNNKAIYDFTSKIDNGSEYVDFRGYSLQNTPVSSNSFGQTNNSYYFYFGIIPGKTGLDKMNQNFFTNCNKIIDNEFNLNINTTQAISNNDFGSVTIEITNGDKPFTYELNGDDINITGSTDSTISINNLPIGSYSILVTDNNGSYVNQNFKIVGPEPLSADISVTRNNYSITEKNGEITIFKINGGTNKEYTYQLFNSSNILIETNDINILPKVIKGLDGDVGYNSLLSSYGYYIIISDSDNNELLIKDLKLYSNNPLLINYTKKNNECFYSENGEIELNIVGGEEPYDINVTDSLGNFISNTTKINNLKEGVYNIVVKDNVLNIATTSIIIEDDSSEMVLEIDDTISKQCDVDNYYIKYLITKGWDSNVKLEINFDDIVDSDNLLIWETYDITDFVDVVTPNTIIVPKEKIINNINLRLVNNTCYSEEVYLSVDSMVLPKYKLEIISDIDFNKKQCNLNTVSFRIKEKNNNLIDNNRLPYTIKYKTIWVNDNGEVSTDYVYSSISSFNDIVTLQTVDVNGDKPKLVKIEIQLVDNVGCESNVLYFNIDLPINVLNGYWVNEEYLNTTANQTWVHKKLIVDGGITPYISNYTIYDGTDTTIINQPKNTSLYAIVKDSVGCIINING